MKKTLKRIAQRRGRAGFSLIELLLILTINTFLVGIVASSLVVLHRSTQSLQRQAEDITSLTRLVADFRHDIANADSVTSTAQDTECEVKIDSTVIRYAASPHGLRRIRVRDDKVLSRDFYLEGEVDVAFEKDIAARSVILSLQDEAMPPVRVVAALHDRATVSEEE